jgi:hypothetical protein
MALSHRRLSRWHGGTLLVALGFGLVGVGPVAAQPPPGWGNVIPLGSKGFQVSLAQQRFWQRREVGSPQRTQQGTPETTILEPRFVTIIGPDGRARSFQIAGPITVVPVRQTVAYYGANNTAGPVVMVPVRPSTIHFGSNH